MTKLNSVGGRLLVIPAIALVGFLILGVVMLNSLGDRLMEGREARVEAIVDAGLSIIRYYQQQEEAGVMSRADAQALAITAIRAIRYDGTEYLWINDTVQPLPNMIMHATVPALDGTRLDKPSFNYATLLRNRDGSVRQALQNENLFASFVTAATRFGDGFVEYQWPRPLAGGGVTEERYPKLSFVSLDRQWGWVVGSGIYIDDVNTLFRALALRIGLIIGVITLLTVAASLLIRRWLLQSLGGEVDYAKQLVNQVAAGDFTVNFDLSSSRPDSLLAALGTLVQRMRNIMQQQDALATRLLAQSESVDTSNQHSQHLLQQMLSQTMQVATAVSQMSSTCDAMARNASNAAKATRDAGDEANAGVNAVAQTIEAIEQLRNSLQHVEQVIKQLSARGEEVGSVTDVIGSIAEQTNLLALNAAIEAARAGEMGRGFAVVADEVRTLASRSQLSTQDITQKVQSIQQDSASAVQSMASSRAETERTIQCSEQANAALSRISHAVGSMADINDQLASATEEMASVSATINQNMENIAAAVDTTHLRSDELVIASQQLRKMAAEMKAILAGFRM
ncbi:methyl-accepting chemotaxis protein [Cellvibrio polysaccharolyticus]|nr:methyl-accepting chemotaxis protein [Cellvibrio polysaccharolyticus]